MFFFYRKKRKIKIRITIKCWISWKATKNNLSKIKTCFLKEKTSSRSWKKKFPILKLIRKSFLTSFTPNKLKFMKEKKSSIKEKAILKNQLRKINSMLNKYKNLKKNYNWKLKKKIKLLIILDKYKINLKMQKKIQKLSIRSHMIEHYNLRIKLKIYQKF